MNIYFVFFSYFFSLDTPKRPKNHSLSGSRLFGAKPATPVAFRQVIKHNSRHPVQLKFDVQVMRYFATTSLAFNHANTEGFHTFVKYLDPKLHIKSDRTLARSKLPLLYKNVQNAIARRLEIDLAETSGVGFTTDIWTSK